jgi:hypothetical protein
MVTMECRHPGCRDEAAVRVVTPFGTGNFCAEHASELSGGEPMWRREHGVPGWLKSAFRYGPAVDPPLTSV